VEPDVEMTVTLAPSEGSKPERDAGMTGEVTGWFFGFRVFFTSSSARR